MSSGRRARGCFGGEHQSQLVVGVGNHLQQIVQLSGQFAADDGQIDLAIGHAPARSPGAVHLQLDRHIRIFLSEQADHARHEVGARGLAGPHHQRPTLEVVEVVQGPAGLLALAQDAVAVAQQQVAGLGELGLATPPVEQGNIQLLLEILDLEADGGLGDIKAVGGLLETALTGNRPQDAQLIKGEGQVCHGWRKPQGRPWWARCPESAARSEL